MGNVSKIVKQMKKEREKVEKQLSALNLALSAFVGTYYGNGAKPTRKKRTMSAAGGGKLPRLNVRDGQRFGRRKRPRKSGYIGKGTPIEGVPFSSAYNAVPWLMLKIAMTLATRRLPSLRVWESPGRAQ